MRPLRSTVVYAALVAACVVACTYTAPDYGGVHFRCDDTHGCPPGVACVGGYCGGAASGADAGGADASLAGVVCGSMSCASGLVCCNDFVSAPACQAASAPCGGVSSACDGPEDCTGGQLCCFTGTGGTCASSCTGGEILCHDATDCAGNGGHCCPTPALPWEACFSACP